MYSMTCIKKTNNIDSMIQKSNIQVFFQTIFSNALYLYYYTSISRCYENLFYRYYRLCHNNFVILVICMPPLLKLHAINLYFK